MHQYKNLYNEKVDKSSVYVESVYLNYSGTAGPVTTNAPSITATRGILCVAYGYSTTVYHHCIPSNFSIDWNAQININAFNHGTSPVLQLISENILINWTASTQKISITRGSEMHFSNLDSASCSSGSTATNMKIYQVVIVNLTN